MVFSRLLSIGAVTMLGASSVATLAPPRLNTRAGDIVADSVSDERAYAVAIATIADSAIHRLDFFPGRAQLRVQTAFLSPTPDAAIPFDDLAARGNAASVEIDAAVERLSTAPVPHDLKELSTKLLGALKDATRASWSLTTAAHACGQSIASVERCQVPFSSASSRVAESYKRYVDVRAKIRSQVLDTDTHLDDFKRP